MPNTQHQELVKKAVKGRFKGRKPLLSRTVPHYPVTAEREYRRISSGYMKVLNKSLKAHLPAIIEIYSRELRNDSRFDANRDLELEVRREIREISAELEKALAEFGLDDKIRKIARISQNTSVREWKRAVKSTLGIDLFDDYYRGDFYQQTIQKWIADNVSMIKTVPAETLSRMQDIILDGYRNGRNITTIRRQIQDEYNITKSRASFWARDQISTLNSQLSQLQQKDAGCKKYRWSTSKDSRVRECHAELDGKEFSWDDPPEMWYETKRSGTVYTGRYCHPGEDFACRCIAIPVFDIDSIDLPMREISVKGR